MQNEFTKEFERKGAIVFRADREGYGIDQIKKPMTVGQLKELLEDYDDNTLVILSHDSGYTYGSPRGGNYYEQNEDEEWIEY